MSTNAIPLRLDDTDLAVATHGLQKCYGKAVALAGLDLTVPENSFYVLVGPNGAGKSTTLRILLDTVRPDAGTADVFGMDTRRGAAVRAGIGWVPEKHDAQYGWMRVDRLIRAHSAYYPAWDAEYAAHLTRALELKTDRKFGRLSKGEARRVQLLLALGHRPRLLLLDEPTDGLDPGARESVLGILAQHLAEAPATVIVSTHLVYEMDRLADHLGVMRNGALVAQMRRDELDRRMRNYSLEVPPEWPGLPRPTVTLVRGNGRQRERNWMIWGEETEVVNRLTSAGAVVRDVSAVTLEEAAVALLTGREQA